jgi:hypothetical protein
MRSGPRIRAANETIDFQANIGKPPESLEAMMNDINQKLIIALVILPVLVGIFRTPKEACIAVVAIFLALCFANLDKFVRFKGAGFEAELRTAVMLQLANSRS